jgi:fibronectin type 3 domain-containing protein
VDVVFTPAPTSTSTPTPTPTPTPSPSSTCSCTASVSLSWLPATGAASYNVYRGTVASGPYSLLASATQPAYTDNTVISGASYFYEISVAGSETYLALPVAVTIP